MNFIAFFYRPLNHEKHFKYRNIVPIKNEIICIWVDSVIFVSDFYHTVQTAELPCLGSGQRLLVICRDLFVKHSRNYKETKNMQQNSFYWLDSWVCQKVMPVKKVMFNNNQFNSKTPSVWEEGNYFIVPTHFSDWVMKTSYLWRPILSAGLPEKSNFSVLF